MPESEEKKEVRKTEELVLEARNFFETYKKEIGASIREGNNVIYLDFSKIASFSHEIAELLFTHPEEIFQVLEVAISESGLITNPRVRLNVLPEEYEEKIRNLRVKHLNKMIQIEGLVRQASEVRPQVVNAKFECPACGTIMSVLQIESRFREPSRCSCGRKGSFKLISKDMVDVQRLVIEESPESLIGGEQPRRMNVFLKEDLVEPKMEERTTPGSRVKIIGVLKEIPKLSQTGSILTRYDIAVEANNVVPMEETFQDLKISEEDERQIKELAADPSILKKFTDSIAPSIYGHDEVKKSLVLQLFGGVKKVKGDGTQTRGDIHVLLVGDPGVAKSLRKNEKVMYISSRETGYKTIENIYKKFKRFPKGLKVLTIDMKNHEPKWEYVFEIIKHLPEKDLIKITTEHGKSVTATKDHSFITLSKTGEIIPIKGQELAKDMYVPIPINYHSKISEYFYPKHFNKKTDNSKLLPEKIKLDEDFGFFFGIFLAEGYIKNKNAVEISNKDKEIQIKVIKFAKKMNINFHAYSNRVILYSKTLSDILMNHCYDAKNLKFIKKGVKGNYSKIKKIPEFLFFAPREFIYSLVSGLFSGDGRLIKDEKMLKGFELITVSKELAEYTSDILFSIGIINKLKKRSYIYKGNKTNYFSVAVPTYMIGKFLENIKMHRRNIKVNKKKPIYSYNNLLPCGDLVYKVVKKLGYNSRISGNRTLAAEMRTVRRRGKIGRLRLLRLIKRFEKKPQKNIPELETLKKIANSNIVWSKITDIAILEKKNEEVYDLSIPETNTFVANGIGVHNSQLLKFISGIAPKGRYIVGKAASGAGITATVVRDEFLRGWSLEAGAMVLANKGMVCIDEIDKMDPQDRSALHEGMEQQCYHYDTIITLADGSEEKIGQLVERYLKNNEGKIIEGKDCRILPVNDLELFTTDWKSIFKTKAARISKHKAFDKFIKLKFSNGREIVVTPEHPVFCAENGEITTKRADSIKIGEDIPIPLTMPIQGEEQRFNTNCHNSLAKTHIKIPEKNSQEIYKILGYFISEGSREINNKRIIGINFTNQDERLVNDFEECMKIKFNILPYKQVKIENNGNTTCCCRYTSTELAEFFKLNFPETMKTSGEKQVPQLVMKARKEDISKFLSCLFEGDGYVSVKTRTIRIGYKTKSRRLAEQIQDLLLRFSIRSNITSDREYFRVGITSHENIGKFMQEIGFVTPEKNILIEKYLKEKTIKRTVKDIIPSSFNEKIVSIIKDENIENVGKYSSYSIEFDHLKRKNRFSFSRYFLLNLMQSVKKPENKEILERITSIGWEKIIGLELINNETENWVYDITIEPNHSFVSQAAILHNTITISKANIQATLRSETSVLASGNPKFGRFDPFQTVASQIDIPPALINRFDVIFILKDSPDRAKDEAIAMHVLSEHQRQDNKAIIDKQLMRKYIAYSKQKTQPKLTDEAVDEIKKFYVDLRNMPTPSDQPTKPLPISARQLEALIRLSESVAKSHLGKKVSKEDAKVAIDLMKYYLMQVGYDYETKTFDIDRIATGVSTSQRSKIILVRETLARLESRLGKLIPIEEVKKELEAKIEAREVDEAIDKLTISGDIFHPRKGFVQRM